MSAAFTSRYIGSLVVFGLLVAGAEYAVIENYMSSVSEDDIYDTSTERMANNLTESDIYTARARLAAEVGIMTLSLEELQDMFHKNFRYIPDVYAYQSWKRPSLFIKEGGGDCEDYMLFALATLDREKYDMKPILGSYAGEGHAFLIARDKDSGTVYLVDNGGVREMPSDAWKCRSLPPQYEVDRIYGSMLEKPFLGVF